MTKGSTVALIVWIMCRQPKKIYFPLRITDWTFPLPEEIQLLLFLQKVGFIQGRSSQSWFAGPQNGWGWTAQAGPSHRAGCTGPRATSRQLLEVPKEDSPQPLCSLCHCSATCTVTKCFLIFRQSFVYVKVCTCTVCAHCTVSVLSALFTATVSNRKKKIMGTRYTKNKYMNQIFFKMQ